MKCAAHRLAEHTGCKNYAKQMPSTHHNFVGLYLHKWGMYRQSEKNSLNSDISSTCPHNVNFGQLTAEIAWQVWGTPANFNRFRTDVSQRKSTKLCMMSGHLLGWYTIHTLSVFGVHSPGHSSSVSNPRRWSKASLVDRSICRSRRRWT